MQLCYMLAHLRVRRPVGGDDTGGQVAGPGPISPRVRLNVEVGSKRVLVMLGVVDDVVFVLVRLIVLVVLVTMVGLCQDADEKVPRYFVH